MIEVAGPLYTNKYHRLNFAKSSTACVLAILALTSCDRAWNNPHSNFEKNILYTAFSERPKFLDPARSYSSNEYAIIAQVYEPPLQYHYLKRPYQLVPLTAQTLPQVYHLTADEQRTEDATLALRSVYEITLKPDIFYQPHPAFARSADGQFRYIPISPQQTDSVYGIADFPETGTRELTAADYVYQIKRLADPALHSPVASLFAEHVSGFAEFREKVRSERKLLNSDKWLDLRKIDMPGVKVLDRYRYRITVSSDYPQFIYWLAMPFFAPMPWEADYFYSQPELQESNITLNWYPVGSGAYMLVENNPNLRMMLKRNPNFHTETYPVGGVQGDSARSLLVDSGKQLPFIDEVVFSLEKEDIPYWNKFLQGYYDRSGLTSDSFDQAVRVRVDGEFSLTDEMNKKGIIMQTAITSSVIYIGFNMLDPVVGGLNERAVKLRRALSIAVDMEEFISIFLNGRGLAAQSPLPPEIFGYDQSDFNRYVYDRVASSKTLQRKSLDEARRLLREAGYANGIDQRTGQALILYFDSIGSGPDAKSFLSWLRKQFAKLDIQLVIRNTDYNRFQDKMLNGNAQIFRWGWNADYPDPENFFFLLYGPHAKAKGGGENAANYQNPQFDRLYEQMKSMPNTSLRRQVINEMIEILRHDAPWIWGFHPKSFILHYDWYRNFKPNLMANNTLKYQRIDAERRAQYVAEWNRPVIQPLVWVVFLLVIFLLPAIRVYYLRRNQTAL